MGDYKNYDKKSESNIKEIMDAYDDGIYFDMSI